MYSIAVNNFHRAYRNAGIYVKKKYSCSDINDIISYMEREFSITSRSKNQDHHFDFKSEKEFTMFLLKWS